MEVPHQKEHAQSDQYDGHPGVAVFILFAHDFESLKGYSKQRPHGILGHDKSVSCGLRPVNAGTGGVGKY